MRSTNICTQAKSKNITIWHWYYYRSSHFTAVKEVLPQTVVLWAHRIDFHLHSAHRDTTEVCSVRRQKHLWEIKCSWFAWRQILHYLLAASWWQVMTQGQFNIGSLSACTSGRSKFISATTIDGCTDIVSLLTEVRYYYRQPCSKTKHPSIIFQFSDRDTFELPKTGTQ